MAEIESKIEKYTKRGEESDAKRDGYGMYWGGVLSCLNEIWTLCDTLEVKEVDLNEEIEKCLKRYHMLAVGRKEFTDIAKHFYELGLKAKGE